MSFSKAGFNWTVAYLIYNNIIFSYDVIFNAKSAGRLSRKLVRFTDHQACNTFSRDTYNNKTPFVIFVISLLSLLLKHCLKTLL